MKKSEVKVGRVYLASVNGVVSRVRLDAIRERDGYKSATSNHSIKSATLYDVTNLRTGRQTTFHSATKFRSEVVATPTIGNTTEKKWAEAPRITVIEERADGSIVEDEAECPTCGASLKETVAGERYCPDCDGDGPRQPRITEPVFIEDAYNTLSSADIPEVEQSSDPIASEPAPSVVLSSTAPTSHGILSGLDIPLNEPEPANGSAGPEHIIVIARAGTGKTTTGCEGLKQVVGLGTTLEPSEQQAAVWAAIRESAGARNLCFTAFGKDIATELQKRVPNINGRPAWKAATTHSLGNYAVRKALGNVQLEPNRTFHIIEALLGQELRVLRRDKPGLVNSANQLVGLVKQTLCELTHESLDKVARHYDVDVGHENRSEVYDLTIRAVEVSKDARGIIDYNDMVWLPVVLNMGVYKNDLMIVDESQDLNAARQAFVMKAAHRLLLLGDPRQAIFGFAGADAAAIDNMGYKLSASARDCRSLPLTVTRRCGKAIVEEAKQLVADFEAHPSNPEGVISQARYPIYKDSRGVKHELPEAETYIPLVAPGDMVLCRINAPLVSQCFRFLKSGRRACILGRDIGQSLVSLITRMEATTVPELIGKLDDWKRREIATESARSVPSENRITSIGDRFDCIEAFAEGAQTVQDVIRKVDSMFTDDPSALAVKMSSIHKAKGMEADHVFLLDHEGSWPRVKSDWQQVQEENLRYVAITRAISHLTYVS